MEKKREGMVYLCLVAAETAPTSTRTPAKAAKRMFSVMLFDLLFLYVIRMSLY